MKTEMASIFWDSGIIIEVAPPGSLRVKPRAYKKGRIRDCDLEWLRDNKTHVIERLRAEGDWRELGLDRQGIGCQQSAGELAEEKQIS